MRIVLFLLVLTISRGAGAQTPVPVQRALATMLNHAESRSLYRDRIDWPATRKEVQRLAENVKVVADLAPALRYLLQALGDEHGRVMHGGQPMANYFGQVKPHQAAFNPELYGKIQSAQDFPFRSTMLGSDIGYLRIVGLPMGDNTAMAKQIDDDVCKLHHQGATRWVIDLRYNGGGNLNPMVEGIAGIIGDGALGGWKGLTAKEDGAWGITNGDFVNHGYSVRLANGCRIPSGSMVAVLTSLYTASSGEAMAVMFKGRARTRFFGGKTIGMITVTDWTVVDEATAMTISVGYYKDRSGRVYNQFVDVDEAVVFEPTESLATDVGVQRAVAWLTAGARRR